jgi:hypothetical protein
MIPFKVEVKQLSLMEQVKLDVPMTQVPAHELHARAELLEFFMSDHRPPGRDAALESSREHYFMDELAAMKLAQVDMTESLAGICRFISYDEVSHWLIQGVTPRQIHMIAHMTNEITENPHA